MIQRKPIMKFTVNVVNTVDKENKLYVSRLVWTFLKLSSNKGASMSYISNFLLYEVILETNFARVKCVAITEP